METLAILVAAGTRRAHGRRARPRRSCPWPARPCSERSARALAGAFRDRAGRGRAGGRDGEAREMLRRPSQAVPVVAGGARRQDSVRAGLAALPDGLRRRGAGPRRGAARWSSRRWSEAVVRGRARARRRHAGAVPVADTIKGVRRRAGARRPWTATELAAAQTPQGFRRDVLARAYDRAFADGVVVTDESMAVERLGQPVACRRRLPAQPQAHHAGRPGLGGARAPRGRAARDAATGWAAASTRTAWWPGRPLMLGGVTVPYDRGLEGHSDGDCLLHARVRRAAGRGGRGRHGPPLPEPRRRGGRARPACSSWTRWPAGGGAGLRRWRTWTLP